ncbi:MAG: hypothetical protein IJ396_01505 [Oscillibacter sp.]|nr:hypothetical protein [Oscillibacter sp.]
MNEYRRAMAGCPIPEGLEERLAARVLAVPVEKKSVIRPMSFAKKALLAALLAALLSVSVGAAVLVEWDAVFTRRFGQTVEEVPAAERLFQSVGAESVCGDVTLRISEALGDSQTIYYILEYRLPAEADVELAAQAWGSDDPARQLHLPTIAYYATDAVSWADYEAEMGRWWPDIEWRPQFEGSDYLTERNEAFYRSLPHPLEDYDFPGGAAAGVQTVDFDQSTGTMRFLAFYNRADGGLTENPLTVLVYPPSVTVDGETAALADHPALITFRPTQTARAKCGEIRNEKGTLRASVSPFSVNVSYYGGGYENSGALAAELALVVNGAETPLRKLSMGYGGGYGGGSVTYRAQFDEILNVEAVTALRWGAVEIPLTYET